MEVFVVSFGDSYERYVVGVAPSIEGARDMAREYAYHVDYIPGLDDSYFSVRKMVLGRVEMFEDDVHLNLED